MNGARFLSLLSVGIIAFSQEASAVVIYNSDVTTGADGAFVLNTPAPSLMQIITTNLAPGTSHNVDTFSIFGVRWYAAGGPNQTLVLSFFSGADPNPAGTDALGSATLLGTANYSLAALAAVGSTNYTLPVTGIVIDTPTVAVVARFLNTDQTAFSTVMSARFTTGAPTVGSNDGFFYLDGNTDGLFAGSERVRFNGAVSLAPVATNIRMRIDATLIPIPEPATCFSLGIAGLILLRRRRA